MADIASALRLARVEAGLTLREAAEASGLNKDVISRIERGRQHPQALTVGKLARAYEREPAEFLAGDASPKASAPQPGQGKPAPVRVQLPPLEASAELLPVEAVTVDRRQLVALLREPRLAGMSADEAEATVRRLEVA